MLRESTLEPLGYDDILFIPKATKINSRDDVKVVSSVLGAVPIFSAPMKNISEPTLVAELCNLGGVGVLHRFFEKDEDKYSAIEEISKNTKKPFGISVGVNDIKSEEKVLVFALNRGCKYLVVDTASGYMQKTIDAVKHFSLLKNTYDFKIIAGNVVDAIGCEGLIKAGADIIRVNIGSGAQCLTSKSISAGCPPLTAIKNCSSLKSKYPSVLFLADGGIYTPGHILQSLAFGADGVMMGSLFGRALEAENNGLIFGMSSFELQDRQNKTRKSREGKATFIPSEEMRPLKDIFNELAYGLKSGLSYLDCDDINKLHSLDIQYIRVNK